MTERLRQLMHDEIGRLTPPAPDAATVLTEGRRLRRRSRITTGVAAAAVAAVVVTTAGFVALTTGDLDAREPGPAGSAAVDTALPAYGVVMASGSEVAVGDGRATVPGTVHDMVFTSEGALVRSNPNGGSSDGSGPEALTLVRPDGTTVDLGTIPEGVGPATDPAQPLYALAETEGDGFVAVLRDVRTGEEVGRVPLPDEPPSYWDLPPLALAGDQVYVGFRKEIWSVDWRTGDARQVTAEQGGIPEIAGGRMVVGYGDSVTVTDVATGEELITQQLDGYGYGQLSPDGTHLVVTIEEMSAAPGSAATLYDVDTGRSLQLPAPESGWSWTWTSRGDAMSVGRDGVTVCSVDDGCRVQAVPTGFGGDVKPGGQRFES